MSIVKSCNNTSRIQNLLRFSISFQKIGGVHSSIISQTYYKCKNYHRLLVECFSHHTMSRLTFKCLCRSIRLSAFKFQLLFTYKTNCHACLKVRRVNLHFSCWRNQTTFVVKKRSSELIKFSIMQMSRRFRYRLLLPSKTSIPSMSGIFIIMQVLQTIQMDLPIQRQSILLHRSSFESISKQAHHKANKIFTSMDRATVCVSGLQFNNIGFDQKNFYLYALTQLNPNQSNWKPAIQ